MQLILWNDNCIAPNFTTKHRGIGGNTSHGPRGQHLSTVAGLNQKINNLSAQVKELQNAETNAKKNAKKDYDEKLAAAKNKIHAEAEAAQMGHEYKHVFIQDIFHAGHKLDFSEDKDREIFDLIGR